MKDKPLVSIVIPTYNSEKTLAKCLESIKNQTYKNIEVIVVDKNSEDKTVKIAKIFGAKVYVINAKERSEQRNFGCNKARGKFICFIDSDMELTPKVIEECVRACGNKVSGIIIPEKTIGNNFLGRVRAFERSFYIGLGLIEAARFFVKEEFLKAGMYDENLTGQEDWELPLRMMKLGYSVDRRISGLILHHEENFSLMEHLKKKYYYAFTFSEYIKKHPEMAYKQINPLYRFGLFLKNKRFYSKPLLALGVIILKFLEYFSAGLGFLMSKVRR
jgi:glycosyltransferase involved in cell wall biosynthesis